MSASAPACKKCTSERQFDRIAPFPPGQESTYGVSWFCAACNDRILDVCPVGPLIPTPRACLNCGCEREVSSTCSECGMDNAAVLVFLGIDTDSPLENAKREIA